MGNCIFISPNYPEGHWRYTEALRAAGWTVLAIGDAGDETFPPHLRYNIDDYYRVGDLHDYEQVRRACAYMLWKHGLIGRVETLNEYWSDLAEALRKEYIRPAPDPAEIYAHTQQVLSTLPGSVCRVVSDAEQAKTAAQELGYPLEARRSDEKSAYITVDDDDTLDELSFDGGESYVLSPVSYPGAAAALCVDGKVAALSLYIVENDALIGVPMSEYQREAFGECALAAAQGACAIVHVNAVVCSKGVRGKAKKGELVPAGGSDAPMHEYAVDLLSAEHDCDIRALWAGSDMPVPERSRLACVVSRHGGVSYKRYHEQVLRRLAPRLWYHNSVQQRDRDRFGDYVYIFTAATAAEARRDIRFITELPAQSEADGK